MIHYNSINAGVYNEIPNEDWSTEKETIKYLKKDLRSLFQVVNKFSDHIHRKYSVQVSGSLTISSLAMKIFLSKYYKNNISLINKRSMYEDLRNSYFGGIVEVYKPYGENLFYYDVNSLYPYAALNAMPGCECVYDNEINLPVSEILDIFGFFFCHIKTNDSYLGLLPPKK